MDFYRLIEPEPLLFVKALALAPAPKCNKFRNEQVKSWSALSFLRYFKDVEDGGGWFRPSPLFFWHFHVLLVNLNIIFNGNFLYWALLQLKIWDLAQKCKNSHLWVPRSLKKDFFQNFRKIWISRSQFSWNRHNI